MKQRLTAGILLLLCIGIFCGLTASGMWHQGVRIKAPEKKENSRQYYYETSVNPFYPEFAPYGRYSGDYITGNCTWYAWGRACEIAGKRLPYAFTGDAGSWWETNRKEGWYPYGTLSLIHI